ncbi:hypothetical protein, partial [Klebsiella michiganensis]|uniref:hypothetical protein n=1 Tax=Klebsiella michiganensis TaxID=1134687 RepID=UPI001C47328A
NDRVHRFLLTAAPPGRRLRYQAAQAGLLWSVNLLFCSRRYDLHPFENLRRKGVNEHGPVQLSGVSGKFFPV